LINIKTPEEIEQIRISGRIASQTLDYLGAKIKPGITTERLNQLGHQYILDHGAKPSPLGYRGYPKSLCISINEEVVHGIPGKRRIKEGDIVTIDITVNKNGFHGDTARTFMVGEVSQRAKTLVDATREAMHLGIDTCKMQLSKNMLNHSGFLSYETLWVTASAEIFMRILKSLSTAGKEPDCG